LTPLTALYLDSEDGRALCKRREVPWRARAVAAYALGVLGSQTRNPFHQRKAQDVLLTPFAADSKVKSAHKDVAAAAAIGLAMIPDRDQRVALTLQKYYQANVSREELICAHLPSTIARTLEAQPSPDRERFVRVLMPALDSSEGAPRSVRPGAALALGLLAGPGDPFVKDVTAALCTAVDKELAKNPDAVFLALTALGEIAARMKPGNDVEAFLLLRATAKSGRVATRAWAALALGVSGFAQARRNELTPGDATSATLKETLTAIKDPEQQAAFALALGMRRSREAAPLCAQLLEDVKVDDYRGYFAVALGMMRAKESSKAVHEIVKTSARRPALFQQAAIGLALMGEKSIVPTLLTILKDPKNGSFTVQSAVADSLGYVGDRQAVTPLVELLRDTERRNTTAARTFASVALGQMCDKDGVPWNARISSHLNYFAFLETLTDLIWEL
jgi:HEAT repeat protein